MGSPPVHRAALPHVPALDGLRGLALLGVLFFHAKGALPGGYLGVDLFFVLSGYLITSLLLAEHRDAGRIALSSFWIRRARRLFPALLSLMPAVAVYGRFLAKPEELSGLRVDALATLGYVANWRAIFAHKSYWELFAAPSPLEHMWSLAIEEQFYVLWPLVVVLLLRRGSRRTVLGLALVMTAISGAAMLAMFDPANTSRAYLGTDTRMAAILSGAALAAVLPPGTTLGIRTVRALDVAGVVAAIGLAVAWVKLDGGRAFLYRGGFWLTELASLVLIACAVMGSRSLVARSLSFRPLALIGTISYGLYLWHWPVNCALTRERVHVAGVWLHALQFAVTFAIAIVSYRLLERPIRTRGIPFGRPVYVVPAAVLLSVLLVVLATHARRPTDPVLTIAEPIRIGSDPITQLRVVVLGDSTANSLGWTLRGVRQQGVLVELLGQDGCTMLWDTCGGPSWGPRVKELRPHATLVFLGGAFLHGVTVDGQWRKSCHQGWDSKFEATLAQRLADLWPQEGRVWAVTLPYPLGEYDSAEFRGEVDCINASIRKAAVAVPGVRVMELGERLCPGGNCEREYKGSVIRPDGVHYSLEGGADVARWVLEEVRR